MEKSSIPSISRNLKPKQVLLYQGEVPRDVYLVETGFVRAYVISHSGDEKNVAVFSPGNFLPIGWAFDMAPVAITYYETMTDCSVKVFSKQNFKALITSPEFASQHVATIARQLIGANLQITALSQIHAQDKILRTLYFLMTRFETDKNKTKVTINIPLTQEDIAKFAGLTRETSATELNRLKREGVITVKSKQYTVDVPKLMSKLGEDEYQSLLIRG